jgi:hypothetical protein
MRFIGIAAFLNLAVLSGRGRRLHFYCCFFPFQYKTEGVIAIKEPEEFPGVPAAWCTRPWFKKMRLGQEWE